jgi:hypothetical protein
LAMLIFNFAAGDFGARTVRVWRDATGFAALDRELSVVAALVKTKDDGLNMSLDGNPVTGPLDLLEKTTGSTFSKSSESMISATFRFPVAGAMAGQSLV